MDGSHDTSITWIFIILLIIGAGGALVSSPEGTPASNTQEGQYFLDNNEGGLINDFFKEGNEVVNNEVAEADRAEREGTPFRFSSLFPKGNIIQDKSAIALRDVVVRRSPGGAIIGEQEKRSIATVLDGPVEAFGATWWRLDFEKAPDGWVDQTEISAYVKLFMILNIVPILLENLRWIAIIISLILLCALIYVALKEKALEKLLEKKKGTTLDIEQRKKLDEMEARPLVNTKWQHVQVLMSSQNSNDWRQAIIEADIMLEEMLTKIGYDGASIGEQLKNVEESDFVTLNKAWEAHKVRNRIAHQGSEFVLSHSEAKRIISLYEDVFREFYYI